MTPGETDIEAAGWLKEQIEAEIRAAGFSVVVDGCDRYHAPTGEPFVTFAVRLSSGTEKMPSRASMLARTLMFAFGERFPEPGHLYWRVPPRIAFEPEGGWVARMRVLVSCRLVKMYPSEATMAGIGRQQT